MAQTKKVTNNLPEEHIYRLLEESELTLNGGYRDFKFRFSKGLTSSEGVPLWGCVDFERGIISYNITGADHQAASLTTLHELFHIVLSNCGLAEETERAGLLRGMSNEELTELTSTSFISLVRNNKELFKLIIDAI